MGSGSSQFPRISRTIPPALAYGSKQVNLIPPDSTLTFEVELLEVLAAEEALIPTDYLTRSLQSARDHSRRAHQITARGRALCLAPPGFFMNYESRPRRVP